MPTVLNRISPPNLSTAVLSRKAEGVLESADIQIGGSRPWDIQIHDDRFYRRVLTESALGLGESYMEGWWDVERLDQFFHRLLSIDLSPIRNDWKSRLLKASRRFVNRQRKAKAYEIGQYHYDRGNDLYQAMLDNRMVYTCAYWKGARTLDEAQEAKLDLVCRKLDLQEGMSVLDIGCGWGSFARYAAEKYGAVVVGINNSREQVELGRKMCDGLPVELRLQDYRDVTGDYDRVVSLGMFEHVGPRNYRTYMEVAARCLRNDGLFLLHTIGSNTSVYAADRWTDKYIFPGGVLPSIKQIGGAIETLFVMEDWHNFGADYDRTLMAWFSNFDAAWDRLSPRYGDVFYRMWKYYLLSFAGAFRARRNQLWQIVLSKEGVAGGYISTR